MTLKYPTSRYNNFGGGLNLRDSPDAINDNQFLVLENLNSEGNKLKSMKGNTSLVTLSGIDVGMVNGMTIFSNLLIALVQGRLNIYNLTTGVNQTFSIGNSQVDYFQILATKIGADVTIVLINNTQIVPEDASIYQYDGTNITAQTITGMSNKKFTCGGIYNGKLFLAGNALAPSVMYYSKTVGPTSPANLYDFSAYNGGSQIVGDGELVTGFLANSSEFLIFKTSSVHKLGDPIDTGSAFSYNIKKISDTGMTNPFCAVNAGKETIYFDGITFRRIGYEENIMTLADSSIGKEIEPYIPTLKNSQYPIMNYSYPYVKLYLRTRTSNDNNIAIAYNTVDKAYSIQTGVDVTAATYSTYNNPRRAYVGTSADGTIFIDNVSTVLGGNYIDIHALSKKFNVGDGVDFKRISEMEFHGYAGEGSITFSALVDGDVKKSKTITIEIPDDSSTTGSVQFGSGQIGSNHEGEFTKRKEFRVRIPLFHDGRECQFEIEGTIDTEFELDGFNFSHKFIKAYEKH